MFFSGSLKTKQVEENYKNYLNFKPKISLLRCKLGLYNKLSEIMNKKCKSGMGWSFYDPKAPVFHSVNSETDRTVDRIPRADILENK